MKNTLKTIMISIIISSLIVVLLIILFMGFEKEKILNIIKCLSEIQVQEISEEINIEPIEIIEEIPIVVTQPSRGENYGILKISSINVELPIYYGTASSYLKSGVGHDEKSYMPGEGSSIILMGHNFSNFLGSLPNAKIGDEVEIITNYGEFKYNIYDTKIVKETEIDKVPVQTDEEILMIYTCWPINNVRHASERYVIYAK